MEDLTRLIISNERIENIQNNNIKLTCDEAHYINKVMRIKNGKEIFIANGEGSLWKAIKVKNDCLEISHLKKPYLFQEQEIYLLGIAVVIPKSGFEDILKMCTEIGIDFIQPLFSERQVNKNYNFSRKLLRWNSIIKEAVEQSERLWKPYILNGMEIIEWLKSRDNQERVSISITRENTHFDLNQWLRNEQEFENKKGGIFWNVIGPEGGWSSNEIDFFNKNKYTFVKLSETILRTSTASINASSILNQWRIDLKLRN
ncbi:16S rRNA (uracil(1498)-N(3))-methyltransferase [Prochlorococcus marinus XMU1406]|uniref:16S rRNA (uracil(1498)-N(3))-methyltransferase n=1 Tax=Prochlorococcus marinus TaxID=1219 RepID=UPI001ADA28F5|nr:16S rRNA (uracil(1498)-N(3))-methyltransferase [Prochlorococcus marinus]MBO8206128.1 16S rRNA (uracil(1498)-N(3))-methyltransferase [Prochlorococcus marinus XMU1406]MCR8543801.1 16S rRNA (uracil(1498)-N(3))-methyltransferase [Prochlorococcus marinus XMU1427]